MKRVVVQRDMAKQSSRGVFWFIDDKLLSFPYYEDYDGAGLAKSNVTFNHKKLWSEVCPSEYRKYTYNYFPRGRIDFSNKGKPIVYMNPNIPESVFHEIHVDFGLQEDPKIRYDYSEHYKCFIDDGWKPDK